MTSNWFYLLLVFVLSTIISFLQKGNKRWNSLEIPELDLFMWDWKSTYIRYPSFFDKIVSMLHNKSRKVQHKEYGLMLSLSWIVTITGKTSRPPPLISVHLGKLIGGLLKRDQRMYFA